MRCNGAVKILSFDENGNCMHELVVVDRQDGGSFAPITLITLSGWNMRTSVLVLARQTALRAAVAHALAPIGSDRDRLERGSGASAHEQTTVRSRNYRSQFARSGDLAFLREVQDAVGKLVVLADDAEPASGLPHTFSEGLVCGSQPLEMKSSSHSSAA